VCLYKGLCSPVGVRMRSKEPSVHCGVHNDACFGHLGTRYNILVFMLIFKKFFFKFRNCVNMSPVDFVNF
jgi:hypothetical protein